LSNLGLPRCRRHHQTKLLSSACLNFGCERDERRHLVPPPLQRRWQNRRRGDGDAETSSRLLSGRRRGRAHVTAKTRPLDGWTLRTAPSSSAAGAGATQRDRARGKEEAGGEDSVPVRWIGGARDLAICCGGRGDHRAIRFPIAGPAARGPGSGIEGIRGAIRWGPALSTDPCWCCCWCPCPGPGEGESEVPGPADDESGVPCRLSPSRYSGGCWRSAKRRWCTGGATGS